MYIAEVCSRFASVRQFLRALTVMGFRCENQVCSAQSRGWNDESDGVAASVERLFPAVEVEEDREGAGETPARIATQSLSVQEEMMKRKG